ncbi:hypothetical protein MUB24_15460 [Lederbergia sp. NSJ-179]|uniref:hypothetical protein n=1 Tax=Lederbergia sp. NSJ-179 TaxID=2931402 RepID=UPI001FD2A29C|nr:hypothetical protein [Lederbergia sp. NSJ-179]MCJ7842268.1 hypothetical protein [Lederbergia sp. NSJ-179]
MVKTFCKSCTESVIVPDDILEDMLLDAEKRGVQMVSTERYEARLNQCQNCPSLQYGTTCMHNGALIRYKAKMLDGTCPCPTGSKWIGA